MTRLLLLGASGVDWASFSAKARAGDLPGLAALAARGRLAPLAGAPVTLGPAAWASLASGVDPQAHGVWRLEEEWPGGLRPTSQASWRVPPLCARLSAGGISTGSVAWPASAPGEAWNGLHIDERFAEASGLFRDDWALPLRCAPPAHRAALRERRVHPTDITAAMLEPFVPGLADIDQSQDDGLPTIAIGLARAATIQAAAVWMLSGADAPAPQAVFVHQPWLGRLRLFMGGRREAHFGGVVAAGWRFLDRLAGHLAAEAGEEALVIFASPGLAGAPGVLIAAGPGLEPGVVAPPARLLDIAPSILARFGFADRTLPGRVLAGFAPATTPLAPAPAPPADPPPRPDPAMVHGLRKHGYRPPPRPGRPWRAQGLAELALMVLEQDPARAAGLADEALALHSSDVLALRVKTRAHVALDQADRLPALAEALERAAPRRGWAALARGAFHVLRDERRAAAPWLRKAEADPDAGTRLTTAAVWLAAGRAADAERVFKAVLAQEPANVSALIGLSMSALARREFLAAEATLGRAMALDPSRPAIYLQLAQVYARSGRKMEAARAAEAAVDIGAPAAMAAAARVGRLRG